MQAMWQKAILRRSHGAPEPAGPEALLPGHVKGSHHGNRPSKLTLGRWGTAVACLCLQLLVVLAVYQAHAHFLGPRLQQQQEDSSAAAVRGHSRGSLLELDGGGSGGGGGGGAAGSAWQPRGAALAGQPAAAGGAGALGTRRLQKQCKGCDCTVRLGEADEELLRSEIDRIAKSLADGRAWPGAAADAATAVELTDRVGGWVVAWGWAAVEYALPGRQA